MTFNPTASFLLVRFTVQQMIKRSAPSPAACDREFGRARASERAGGRASGRIDQSRLPPCVFMLVSLCRHYARIYVQATEFSCSLVYDDRNSQRETNAARREETMRGSHASDNRTSCFPLSSPDIWVDCVKCVTAKRQSVVMFSGTCKPGLLFFCALPVTRCFSYPCLYSGALGPHAETHFRSTAVVMETSVAIVGFFLEEETVTQFCLSFTLKASLSFCLGDLTWSELQGISLKWPTSYKHGFHSHGMESE
jgi:hypothetical protein